MISCRMPPVVMFVILGLVGCVAPFVTYPEMFYSVNANGKQQSVFREGETWGMYINGYVGNLAVEVRYEDNNDYLAYYYDNDPVVAKDSSYLPYGKSVTSLADSYATRLDGTILPFCQGKYSITLFNGLNPVNKLYFTIEPGDLSVGAIIRGHMERNIPRPQNPMPSISPSASQDPLGIF